MLIPNVKRLQMMGIRICLFNHLTSCIGIQNHCDMWIFSDLTFHILMKHLHFFFKPHYIRQKRLTLSGLGHQCTLVEMSSYLAATAQLTERMSYLEHLEKNNVVIYADTKCKEVTDAHETSSFLF